MTTEQTKTKNCIVSFANNKGYYAERIARLSDSLRNNFSGDFLGFMGEASCNSPLHENTPYGFKIKAIEKAIDTGYTKILWLDSSCFAIAPIDGIFNHIAINKFIFQDSGHYLGNWSSDKQLNYFGITRDEAMQIKMIGNAGFLGFDWDALEGKQFFSEWTRAMHSGMFEGEWNNNNKTESQDERCLGSRHDMSCSSAILYKMGLNNLMISGEHILQYAGIYNQILNETIILKAQG